MQLYRKSDRKGKVYFGSFWIKVVLYLAVHLVKTRTRLIGTVLGLPGYALTVETKLHWG